MAAQQPSALDNIIALVDLFRPKGAANNTTTTNNSGDITEIIRSEVDPAAIAAAAKEIMESNRGMSAIAPLQKSAGLYNSSTQALLQNDLAARTAAEAAKLNKVETRTTVDNRSVQQKQNIQPRAQVKPGSAAGGLGLLSLGSPFLKAADKRYGLADKFFETAEKAFTPSVETNPFDGAVLDKFDLGSTYTGAASDAFDFSSDAFDVGSEWIDYGLDFGGDIAADFAADFGFDAVDSLADLDLFSDASADWIADGFEYADDFLDVGSDWIADAGGDFIGGFFANGGRVPKVGKSSKESYGKPKRAFADGGKVTSNKPQRVQREGARSAYSNREPRVIRVNPALDEYGLPTNSDEAEQIRRQIIDNQNRAKANAEYRAAQRSRSAERGGRIIEMPEATGDGQEGTPGPDGTFGNVGQAVAAFGQTAAMAALGAPMGAFSVANTAVNANTGKGILGNVIAAFADAFGLSAAPADTISGAMSNQAPEALMGYDESVAMAMDNYGQSDNGGYNSGGFNGPGGWGGLDGHAADNYGNTYGGIGAEGNNGDGGGFGGNSTGGTGGDAGGFGSDGMGGVAANGGEVVRNKQGKSQAVNNQAQRTAATGGKFPGHDTQGKDNLKIRVSGGEYIIPTDVVDIVGEDFFDNIVSALHKPIAGRN